MSSEQLKKRAADKQVKIARQIENFMNQHLIAPKDASGALYFLPGQYLFKQIDDDGKEMTKALSSGQISRAFRDFQTDTGWLERRVLRYSEKPEGCCFLSFEPAAIRRIFVETDDGEIKELKLPLPALILLGRGTEYFLWSAKVKRKITPDTPLAVAPLPNVGGEFSGKVCFGKNEVPKARAENIDAVWNLIFNTPFNQDHKNDKCKSYPKDVRKLLFSLSENNRKSFPSSELIVSSTTIENVWERIVEEKFGGYF